MTTSCRTWRAAADARPTSALTGGAALYKSDGDRCTFLRFGYGDEIQPRVGVNYNVREGKGDKVYVNWGRFYNMDQKSSGRSLAPRRIYQREARFDLAGNLVSDLPRASTTGKLIDPDLEPIYNDEFLAGYATPIRGEWGLDVFYIYRNTEPVHRGRALGVCPTRVRTRRPTCRAPGSRRAAERKAKRTYHAFTVELSRRLARKWSANVSYTWSRFEGNFDLDYSRDEAVFNTSSFIQDGPGTNVEEPNRFGPLEPGSAARLQAVFELGADRRVHGRRLPARPERHAMERPGARLGRRGAELSGAGRRAPEPGVDEPRSAGQLSACAWPVGRP